MNAHMETSPDLCPGRPDNRDGLWDELGSLVSLLGVPAFEKAFYDTCRRFLGNDQCNVFVFDRDLDSSPRCVFSTTSDEETRAPTMQACEHYVRTGFRSDPTLQWAKRTRLAQGPNSIRLVKPQEIGDRNYRANFYDRALVRQKLALFSASEARVTYLNFYRNPDQSDYAPSDHETLALVGGMLGRLYDKHLRLKQDDGQDDLSNLSSERRARLLARMTDVFLSGGAGLTPREAEICAAIALGLTGEGIGLTFGISVNTVATHRKRAYSKLGISSQNELFLRHHETVARQLRAVSET